MKKLPLILLITCTLLFFPESVSAKENESETRTVTLFSNSSQHYSIRIPDSITLDSAANTKEIEINGNLSDKILHIETVDNIYLVNKELVNEIKLQLNESTIDNLESKKTVTSNLYLNTDFPIDTVKINVPFKIYLEDKK